MPRRPANKKKSSTRTRPLLANQAKAIQADTGNRNACLDTLRGLAILLMVIDHVAGLFFDVQIQPLTIRFWTRLSMPLFCVLAGYFLAQKKRLNWLRLGQVAGAAVIVNVLFFARFGQLEILASLIVCFLIYAMLGKRFAWLLLGVFLFPFDPSANLFDFPLTVVAACVAQGVILRQFGIRWAMPAAALGLAASVVVSQPTVYVIYFLPLATLLVAWGAKHSDRSVPGVQAVGRYPLRVYVIQYVLLLSLVMLR